MAAAAADQRTQVQKKTFTKWFNSHLKRHEAAPAPIVDLYQDLRTGIKFFQLLNVIKNEGDPILVPPSKNPRMKLQCLENLNKILAFLKEKGVRLENIGGEDIHAGHSMLTLGLIWTIILRIQISEIEGADAKNYKAALLAWCKMKTKGYKNVNVLDFKRSWMDGLAFNALIHAHRPNLVQMDSLRSSDAIGNLRNAFSVAESIGIDSLLDAEDVVEFPDEKSIMTYLYAYYHFFTSQNAEEISGQRIATFLDFQLQIEEECELYEADAAALLRWIEKKISELSNLAFPNSFDAVKARLDQFKTEYQQVEKPPRIVAKNDLESQLFKIQTLLRAGNRQAYRPMHSMQQVGDSWRGLEHAETRYAQALRDALLRLERLDKLAKKFFTKAERRDEWLHDTSELLGATGFGDTLAEVQASRQREGALVTEVTAYTERLELLYSIAATLVSEDYARKDEVQTWQEAIQSKWQTTHVLLDQRAKQLNEMLLLKRAEKAASDAAAWIGTMATTLRSADVGSNVDEVESLIKAVKLEEASKDGFRATTESHMAGHTAAFKAVQHSQNQELRTIINGVQANFNDLDGIFSTRLSRLQEALEFRQFEANLKEEDLWIQENLLKMVTRGLGDSVTTTDRLLGAHVAQEDEINSHHASATKPLTTSGHSLIANNNPDSAAVSGHLEWLVKSWSDLQEHYREQKDALENARSFHGYAAEAAEGTAWLAQKEEYVSGTDFGKDSFASQSLLRGHAAQVHELDRYKKQLVQLDQQSKAIRTVAVSENHTVSRMALPQPSSPSPPPPISSDVVRVKARAEFKARRDRELTIVKGEILEVVNTNDEKWWKVRRTEGQRDEGYVPATYVKKVKAAVAVAAPATPATEIATHTTLSPEPKSRPSSVATFDFAAAATSTQTEITAHYDRVVSLFSTRRKSLEETIAYHDFCFEATELEIWLEERQRTAQDAELGKEAEQVEMLSRKFELFKEDVMSNVGRVDRFNELANSLIGDDHSDSARIRDRQDVINSQWQALQDLLAGHSESLVASGDIAQYNQVIDEMSDWMQSKAVTMSDDLGQNVASVMYLQRLHKTFTSDLPAIEQRLRELETSQTALSKQYADQFDEVTADLQRPQALWAALSERAQGRQEKLNESLALQTFLSDYRDQLLWCTLMQNKIDAVATPPDEPTADGAIKLLESYQNELMHATLVAERDAFAKAAADLSSSGHYAAAEIAEKGHKISELVAQIEANLAARHGVMVKYQGLRAWERDHVVLVSWLNRQEAFLEKKDLGDSVDAVEDLQKRHGEFAMGIEVYSAKIKSHAAFGEEVVAYGLDDGSAVATDQQALVTSYATLVDRSSQRESELQASAELQKFERQCVNAMVWIEEQRVTAQEPSYEETKLLKSEAQRHATFESSLADFESEVAAIDTAAAGFATASHYASESITNRNTEVQAAWCSLRNESTNKAQKLKEAVQELDFKHHVADLMLFCEDIQKYLLSDDVGKDVASAHELLDRCRRREDDLVAKKEAVDAVSQIADELTTAGHFRANEITQGKEDVVSSYSTLQEPLAERHAALQASLDWHLYQRSMAEANSWIDEKMVSASSEDFVNDLDSCGRMANEHRVINDQIAAQWDSFAGEQVVTASTLVDGGHVEATKIAAMCTDLTVRYEALKATSGSRLSFLDDVCKTAKYFVDSTDSLEWIENQRKSIQQHDLGADEPSTDSATTGHAEVASNAEGHGLIVEQLTAEGRALIGSRHAKCPVPAVEERITLLHAEYAKLTDAVATQNEALAARMQWHQYDASVNESMAWIADHAEAAMSTDIGVDRQGCEALLKQFADFRHDVDTARGKRLDEITSLGAQYVVHAHVQTSRISERMDEVLAAWTEMAETIDARSALLACGHEIHTFYEHCEGTSSRISEKTVVANRTDYGDDLTVVESLAAEHKVFEIDLEAVKKQVGDLVAECDSLRVKFGQKEADLTDHLSTVTSGWADLEELTAARRAALMQSLDLQRFLVNHARVTDWVADVVKEIRDTVPSDELDQAEALRQEHGKLKAEIDARAVDVQGILAEGADLQNKHPDIAKTLHDEVENLRGREMVMVQAWTECDRLLRESSEGLAYEQDSQHAEALLKRTQDRLDAAVQDPAQSSSAEILELIENVKALERAIHANAEHFLQLQQLTQAERVELESTGGVDAVKEYERKVEAAQLQRIKDVEATAEKQRHADAVRAEALAEAEEERRAEEAQRAHRRSKDIAARATDRKAEQDARRKASAELAARMSEESAQRRATASVSAQRADERRVTLRHASDARVAAAAAKMAAAKQKVKMQTLHESSSTEA